MTAPTVFPMVQSVEDDRPKAPPAPGKSLNDRVENAWALAWETNNRHLDLHSELVQLGAGQEVIQREMRASFAALGVKSAMPPLPAMRGETPTLSNLEPLAQRAIAAAAEGERRPDTTAEEQIRMVFAQEEARRDRARELERLRVAVAEANAETARTAAAKQAKKDARNAFFWKVGGVVGGAVGIKLLEWALSHL